MDKAWSNCWKHTGAQLFPNAFSLHCWPHLEVISRPLEGCGTRELVIDHCGIKQIMRLGIHLSSLILRSLLTYRISTVASVSFLFPQIDVMTRNRRLLPPWKFCWGFHRCSGGSYKWKMSAFSGVASWNLPESWRAKGMAGEYQGGLWIWPEGFLHRRRIDCRFQSEPVWKLLPPLYFTIKQIFRSELSGVSLYPGLTLALSLCLPVCKLTSGYKGLMRNVPSDY